jgi:uncharacterized protein YkwD
MAGGNGRKVSLVLQQLEDRQLLSGNISFNPVAGVVRVNGTPHSDKVVVSYARGNRVKVVLTGGAEAAARFPQAGVTDIVFRGHGGGDRLKDRTTIPATLITPPRVRVNRKVPSGTSGGQWVSLLSAEELLIFQQINNRRLAAGRGALRVNPLLQEAAQNHADNMAREDRYGDTDTDGHILDGHDVVYRVAVVGYRWSSLGELVGFNAGFPDPAQELMNDWWNSPPHHAIMLMGGLTEVGVGVATGASGRTYGDVVLAAPV